jgi:hypothetical protein
MITPLEASSIFATLVGLICNWRDERGRASKDKFEDFITWLTNHNFHALKDRIFESEELQRQLTEMLRQDYDTLSEKLDSLTGAISAISDKIDTFGEVGRALRTSTENVSIQALAILKCFDASEAPRMVVFEHPPSIWFVPKGASIKVGEPRFLETDVRSLACCGLIEHVDYNKSGNLIYSITRAGARIAALLPDEYLPKTTEVDTD